MRPHCPRCGAALGVLDVTAGADAVPTPASWYCGCCGLVLASSGADAARQALDLRPS